MILENFKKYRIDKKLLSKMNGAGYGSVTCNNGDTFDATASSADSVESGADVYCRHRGGVANSWYMGDAEIVGVE